MGPFLWKNSAPKTPENRYGLFSGSKG